MVWRDEAEISELKAVYRDNSQEDWPTLLGDRTRLLSKLPVELSSTIRDERRERGRLLENALREAAARAYSRYHKCVTNGIEVDVQIKRILAGAAALGIISATNTDVLQGRAPRLPDKAKRDVRLTYRYRAGADWMVTSDKSFKETHAADAIAAFYDEFIAAMNDRDTVQNIAARLSKSIILPDNFGTLDNSTEKAARTFTAREAELNALNKILVSYLETPGPCVVAVTGIGGVGKTTLVDRWTEQERVKQAFKDLVVWIDLYGFSATRAPADAYEALVQLCTHPKLRERIRGMKLPREPSAAAQQFRWLASELNAIIVLDNVHSKDHAGPLLPQPGQPYFAILTSRSPLMELPTKSAIHRLILERFSDQESRDFLRQELGLAVDEDETSTEVVVRLSAGLPLALRITASRAKRRKRATVASLAESLTQAEAKLATFQIPRAQDLNLRTVFQSSYDRLDADEQRVFRL